jgi:hypothetical protein
MTKNRIAQQVHRDAFANALYEERGQFRNVLYFSSESEVSQRIPDISKLPSAQNNVDLQDEDGNFYFYIGYSDVDGPDIIP